VPGRDGRRDLAALGHAEQAEPAGPGPLPAVEQATHPAGVAQYLITGGIRPLSPRAALDGQSAGTGVK
jgi:hypothetical protein